MNADMWDVVVVGGGAAGLSGALMLGRARRRVLVVDSGEPRNRFTSRMHGVLGRDSTSPADLLADGRREVESYRGTIHRGAATAARTAEGVFAVEITDLDGNRFEVLARRLLVATGVRDDLPAIAGLREWWGRGVATCPYCDAYEVGDGRIGVLATGPGSPGQAQLLRQWSDSIVYLADSVGPPQGDELSDFRTRGIEIAEGLVERVLDNGDRLRGVRLQDGTDVLLDAIFTIPTLVAADGLLRSLGATVAPGPMGEFVTVDGSGRTSVDGVWAAGNVVNPAANVPMSIGAGAMAGGAINHDLVLADIAGTRTANRS
ncbi:NAD(P)/FAD-dependent oxidoreductase [Lentzea sp. HUAS12]|uniref:NAD(P)/FAD-dependent oxidoreductase n=1 Tax=Lentzea sp. HUAS12 TaxID=2951806 RepID=UPI0020A190B0|nr:NAD(P)/FAD-dependent oxidoreductase [Lentzea sp. HUAS12]USX48991.1 NAD(P)/FAD-dependent oxidoreductase [Lentzea sp. HUAS12]